jgi:hypothetical protein
VPELSEPDECFIRQYVESQSPADDPVTLVQSVGSQRILGRRHDLYDVHCETTRWWVITDPTNLYQQSDFPEVDQALIFHLGLGMFIAERNRRTLDDPGSPRTRQQLMAPVQSSDRRHERRRGIRGLPSGRGEVSRRTDRAWQGTRRR